MIITWLYLIVCCANRQLTSLLMYFDKLVWGLTNSITLASKFNIDIYFGVSNLNTQFDIFKVKVLVLDG